MRMKHIYAGAVGIFLWLAGRSALAIDLNQQGTLPGVTPGSTLAPTTFLDPLFALLALLTGPVAVSLTIGGMLIAGATLIFARNEMSEFVKTTFSVVLVGCVLVFSVNIVTALFGVTVEPSELLAALPA